MDLHRQIQFLGQGDMCPEGLALQFRRVAAGAEQVHAGFADRHDLTGVGGGETVDFGDGLVEIDVMPGLVFHGQPVRAGRSVVAVQHRFIGMDRECRMHKTRVIDGHLDRGHQVRQLATHVDDTRDADSPCLIQQLVDGVDGHGRLSPLLGLMAHAAGEGHH